MIKEQISKLWSVWERFIFFTPSYYVVGVFRFLVGLTGVVLYTNRILDWRFYFTDDGPVQLSWAFDAMPEFYRPLLTWFPTSGAMILGLHILFIVLLLTLCLGIGGRLNAIAVMIINAIFLQRNFTILYGADRVIAFWFFFLVFTDCNREFSLARHWGWKKSPPNACNDAFTAVGFRLSQIQLCVIYGITGMEKLKGGNWWDGSALWAIFGNRQLMLFDLSWMRELSFVIPLMTFGTVLFEIYFPVLIWLRPTRPWVLSMGVVFHFLIGLTMGIPYFSAAMLAAYVLFCDESLLRKWNKILGERHIPVLSK
jgi:hypothetical protein